MISALAEAVRTRGWLVIAQRVFLVLALAALATYVVLHWGIVVATAGRLRISTVLATGSIMFALHFLIVLSFHCLHLALGIRRSMARAFDSYFARLPGRFLPGGVWHSVMRYGDMHVEKAAPVRSLGWVFVGEGSLVASSALVAAGILGLAVFRPFSQSVTLAGAFLFAGIGMAVVLGGLCLRYRGVRTWKLLLVAFVLMTVVWSSAAFAFALLSASGQQPMLAMCNVGEVAATYAGAASVGYIAVFAPQGWGVTELVFAAMRPCPAPAAALVTAIFAFRLVSLATDTIAFVGVMLLRAVSTWRFR